MTVDVLRNGEVIAVESASVHPKQSDEERRGERRVVAKRLCREKILAVVDETAQINLAAAAAAGALSASDLATYQAGLAWIMGMRAAWPELANDLSKELHDSTHWPQPTQAIQELANAF